jgi:hypothetical protein
MELTLADALGIFRGWKENTSPVTFFLDNGEALVKVRGIVTEVLDDELVVANDDARVRLGLKNAEFQYQDRREKPWVLRQISESEFVTCVEVCLPSEGKCFLFELESVIGGNLGFQ